MSGAVDLNNSTGKYGTSFISGTSAVTPTDTTRSWFAFVPTETAVIAAISQTGMENSASMIGKSISAGVPIQAQRITSITLTSGNGLAYYNLN